MHYVKNFFAEMLCRIQGAIASPGHYDLAQFDIHPVLWSLLPWTCHVFYIMIACSTCGWIFASMACNNFPMCFTMLSQMRKVCEYLKLSGSDRGTCLLFIYWSFTSFGFFLRASLIPLIASFVSLWQLPSNLCINAAGFLRFNRREFCFGWEQISCSCQRISPRSLPSKQGELLLRSTTQTSRYLRMHPRAGRLRMHFPWIPSPPPVFPNDSAEAALPQQINRCRRVLLLSTSLGIRCSVRTKTEWGILLFHPLTNRNQIANYWSFHLLVIIIQWRNHCKEVFPVWHKCEDVRNKKLQTWGARIKPGFTRILIE